MDGGKRGTLWRRRARDSSPSTESTLLSQPLHFYGVSASCLWCGYVEVGDKLPVYLEASRAPAVFDRLIDSPQNDVAQTRNASAMAAMRKLGAASTTLVRRKTLCDITNPRRLLEAEAHEGQQDGLRCADGVDGITWLVKARKIRIL